MSEIQLMSKIQQNIEDIQQYMPVFQNSLLLLCLD